MTVWRTIFYLWGCRAAAGLSALLAALPSAALAAAPPAATKQLQAPPSPPPAAPAADIYDIKPPIVLSDNTMTLLIAAAIVFTIVLLAIIGWYWWKRTRRQRAVLAHETALKRLQRAGVLIEGGRVEEFVTLIDQTLRHYIEQRFGVSAPRQTTREFITGITESRAVPAELARHRQNLQTWLEHCDLVKYARAGLTRETMEAMLANLRDFIASTQMKPDK